MAKCNNAQLGHFCFIRGKKNFFTSPLKMTRVVQKFRFHRAVLHHHSRISVVVSLSHTAARALLSHKTHSNCNFDRMSRACDVAGYLDSLCCMTNSTCSKEKRSSKKPLRWLSAVKGGHCECYITSPFRGGLFEVR